MFTLDGAPREETGRDCNYPPGMSIQDTLRDREERCHTSSLLLYLLSLEKGITPQASENVRFPTVLYLSFIQQVSVRRPLYLIPS